MERFLTIFNFMPKYILLSLSILLFTIHNCFSQDCFEFYKSCNEYVGRPYEYDDNTGSFLLTDSTQVFIEFDAIKGIDYQITICDSAFNIPLHFEILDNKGDILFDNSLEEMTTVFAFSVVQNKVLNVRVEINQPCIKYGRLCSGCVGILIEKSIKPRTGF